MNIENILNRAYAHWIKDGIIEIWIGILFTGVGILRAIIHFAGEKSATYYWLSAGLLVFMLGVAGGGTYVVKLLKARITYPRTGYTAFKPYSFNYKSILAILALFIIAGIFGGTLGWLSNQPDQQKMGVFVPIVMGIYWALAFTYAAHRLGVKRLYYLAVIFVVIGLAIGALGVGVVLGVSFFYLSIGLALVVTGCVALVQYLRSHEPVDLSGVSH